MLIYRTSKPPRIPSCRFYPPHRYTTKLAILKSVTHRADGVGVAGVDAVEDVCGGVGLRAAAARRALLLLLVAGGGVVARARVKLEGAQVPPANRTPIVIWNLLIKIYDE